MTKKTSAKNPATRADLKLVEAEMKDIKFDIKIFKGDLKLTKWDIMDIKKTQSSLRVEILKVKERVGDISDSQKRSETTLNKISNQLDGFVGRVDDLTTDNVVGTNQIHELRDEAKDHEKRISKLESSQINPQ